MSLVNLLKACACAAICMSLPAIGQDLPRYDFAGSATWIGQVPILVAIEKGFFTEEGIEVELQVIGSSADRIRALTAGDAAFSNLGRVAVITEMARGNESFSFFANVDDSPGQEGCWARPRIETVADMKGRPVAANSSAEITLIGLLADAGLTLEDVSYTNLPGAEMAVALSRGNVEVACVWQPLLGKLQEAVPDGKLLGTDKDTEIFRTFGTMAAGDVMIISRQIVAEHPEHAAAIAAGVMKGADYTLSSPKETAEAVAHYFRLTPEEMQTAIEGFDYYGSENWPAHLEKHAGQIQYLSNMLAAAGRIPTSPNTALWLDSSFVPKPN